MVNIMVTAVPAYGRDYKSVKALLQDWEAGKDFKGTSIILGFDAYFSKRDIQEMKKEGIGAIQFRYDKQRKVYIMEIK